MIRFFLVVMAFVVFASPALAGEEKILFGQFGEVTVYSEKPTPAHVVLFFSGDEGWTPALAELAKELASMDALVIGVDSRIFLKHIDTSNEQCYYASWEFEELSKYIQKRYNFQNYTPSTLVGHGSGGTLVYAVLVQGPLASYRGGISMAFNTTLRVQVPQCEGKGLKWEKDEDEKGTVDYEPREYEDGRPWILLQGELDKKFTLQDAQSFVDDVEDPVTLVSVAGAGREIAEPKQWSNALRQAFTQILEAPLAVGGAGSMSDLPLVDVPSKNPGKIFGVFISGDGGWASIDRDIGGYLAKAGVPVAGVDALKYFWTRRTPAQLASDFDRILRHYRTTWKADKVMLIGYSLGAEVIPLIVNRLPEDTRAMVELLVLLSPGPDVELEFHVLDWVHGETAAKGSPLMPEIQKLGDKRIVCYYGDKDNFPSLCPLLQGPNIILDKRVGDHHFNGDWEPIAESILQRLGVKR